MNEYSPITVAEAGAAMAPYLGLRWPSDRDEVLRNINLFMSKVYSDMPSFGEVTVCTDLQKFAIDCNSPCECHGNFYWGATLPQGLTGVVAAWRYDDPVILHSRWQEFRNHRITAASPDGRYDVYEVGGAFPTYREIQSIDRLAVFCEDPEDAGRKMRVTILADDNTTQTVEFELVADGWAKSDVRAKGIQRVVLPKGRVGNIVLAQDSGFELSRYTPTDPEVPSFRRIKVGVPSCVCRASKVSVVGMKTFKPLRYDTDIVEIGDNYAISLAARHFRYFDSKDREEQQSSLNAWVLLKQTLQGLDSRNRGNQYQDFPWSAPVNRTTNLYLR